MSAPFQIPSDEINFEPQSYGDPNGRVFGWQDQIYRGIKRQKTDFYKELVNSALIQTLIQKQVLIPTEITNLQLLNYGLVLKHKKLPIISYAFEWSFDALKDAALVILSLQAELSKNGLTLQDAHPWNVLFDGSHPLFVDFCSIVPAVDRSWRAYDEFRRFFLNPLRLMSEGQGRIARWLLHDDNAGVSDYEFSCILDGKRLNNLKQQARRWLRPVRAALHESLSPSVRSAIKKVITRRGEAFTSDSLEETRRQIEALQLPSKNTIWSDYFRDYFSIPFVPSPEWSPKEHSVHQVLCKLKPSSVLDIGCNTGWYSQLAASMGFTPTARLLMSTRSGDLDPGLAPYLARTERMTTKQFYEMVNHKSGLLGVSETSSDMRDLLDHEKQDVRAAEAVALFCYPAKKWLGSFAAALGGLDTLVFAGGIGENAPLVRARICEGLRFLGIELNESRNAESAGRISTDASRVMVRVIRTDEELMIARSVCRVLGLGA